MPIQFLKPVDVESKALKITIGKILIQQFGPELPVPLSEKSMFILGEMFLSLELPTDLNTFGYLLTDLFNAAIGYPIVSALDHKEKLEDMLKSIQKEVSDNKKNQTASNKNMLSRVDYEAASHEIVRDVFEKIYISETIEGEEDLYRAMNYIQILIKVARELNIPINFDDKRTLAFLESNDDFKEAESKPLLERSEIESLLISIVAEKSILKRHVIQNKMIKLLENIARACVEAIKGYRKSPAVSFESKTHYKELHKQGMDCYHEGKYLEAIDIFKTSLHLAQTNGAGKAWLGTIKFNLAKAYKKNGDNILAEKYFKEAKEDFNDPALIDRSKTCDFYLNKLRRSNLVSFDFQSTLDQPQSQEQATFSTTYKKGSSSQS